MPYEVQSHCLQCNRGDTVLIGNWPDHLGIFVCQYCKALVNIQTDIGRCPGCGYEPVDEEFYDHSFSIPYIGGKFKHELEQGPLCPKCGGVPLTFETNTHINMRMVIDNGQRARATAGRNYMEKAIFLNSMTPVIHEFRIDAGELLDYFNLEIPNLPLVTKRVSFPIYSDIRIHVATRLTMENEAFGCKLGKEEIISRFIGASDAVTENKAMSTTQDGISPADETLHRDELSKLQGTWVLVETTAMGKTIGEETLSKGPPITLVIEGNTYHDRFKGTFEIDPTKTPKWLDRFPPAEAAMGSRKQLCIYQFEGERLRIRTALPSVPERPADFATSDRYVTMLYARVPKA